MAESRPNERLRVLPSHSGVHVGPLLFDGQWSAECPCGWRVDVEDQEAAERIARQHAVFPERLASLSDFPAPDPDAWVPRSSLRQVGWARPALNRFDGGSPIHSHESLTKDSLAHTKKRHARCVPVFVIDPAPPPEEGE